jgi:hypothetical protein
VSPQLAALLFAFFVALIFAIGFGVALWCDLSREIDEATRLPQHPRPAPAVEPPTERIPANNVIDIRRARSTFEETA